MGFSSLQDIIVVTASATSIVSVLSGIPVCKKFIDNGTTGETSPMTFMAGFLSSSLWFLYGVTISDRSTIIVNTIGSLLQLCYVVTYYMYTLRKSTVLKGMAGVIVVLLLTLLYLRLETNLDTQRYRMGLICTFVTIMFFAAPLSNLAHVIRVRSAESLPFPIIFMTFLSSAQWLIYGILLNDPFMKVVNVIGTMFSIFQLSLFVIYRSPAASEP